MPSTFEFACAAANEHERQVVARMRIAVRDARAIEDRGVIEQRSITVLRLPQPLEVLAEELGVVRVDFRHALDQRWVVAMMRERVVRFRHADLRVRPCALLLADHERDDAREVRLERQQLQVEHECQVIFEHGRHALWLVHKRQLEVVLLFSTLDATFDVANRLGVLLEATLILRSEITAKARQLLVDRVENAAMLMQPCLTRTALGAAAVAEQFLEDRPRVVFHRQGLRGALPRNRVRVGAAQDARARTGVRRHVHRQLERRHLRLLPELLRQDLVHRDIGKDLDLVPTAARRAGQEGPRGAGVNVVPVRLQARDDDHLVSVRLQRLEDGRQDKVLAHALRRPERHGHAVGDVEGLKAMCRLAGRNRAHRERGHHGVEERQRERGAETTQNRATRQRFG